MRGLLQFYEKTILTVAVLIGSLTLLNAQTEPKKKEEHKEHKGEHKSDSTKVHGTKGEHNDDHKGTKKTINVKAANCGFFIEKKKI